MRNNKVIILSAPSGAGKSTVVAHLLSRYPQLEFSITATTRNPRGTEQHGKEYYFFTHDEFQSCINKGDFVEWEEVYKGSHYGTLKSEVERIWKKGHVILFDVDVKGGVNLKSIFGKQALSIFIKTPSIDVLRERLILRRTDSPENIEIRIAKARQEFEYEDQFDEVVINDVLEETLEQVNILIDNFLKA